MATSAEIDIEPQEIEARADEFETAPAGKVIAWAVERFSGNLVVATSFQDLVLVDLAVGAFSLQVIDGLAQEGPLVLQRLGTGAPRCLLGAAARQRAPRAHSTAFRRRRFHK